ncbi:hypothetical protein O3P69_005287 [Scylla paramamosain]|uniref:Ionotropic glutamate receptor L-glutamate and glycine-binding domain-containing protein n=1 Tax=Scylla paramamosain TaxID=85552 RepID=A0AAW0UB71_SCYPA
MMQHNSKADRCSSFQLIISKYPVYGYQQPNGSWTGLIGELQRQEVDFAGTLFAVTPERLGILDFSEALYFDEYNTLYILPDVTADMVSFMKPYSLLIQRNRAQFIYCLYTSI